MPSLHLRAVAAALGASYAGPPLDIRGVAIDSRTLQPGDLFVALRGEREDGHAYVAAAAAAGAVGAVVEEPVDAALPLLQVADAREALTLIGRRNRDAYAGDLLAITGSCGKTSVKNLCLAIFEKVAPTVATRGNYNNELGVPLTLARLAADTRFAVIEMGATRRGDVAHLCRIARPRVGTVLNAMEAHLQGFGTVADVADAKAEIYDQLGTGGVAVLNLDQPWTDLWQRRIAAGGAQSVTWSLRGAADVTAADIDSRGLRGTRFRLCIRGAGQPVELALPGRHNVGNALAAAALATACDIPIDAIAAGLGAVRGEPGRGALITLPDGTALIDDSYNANPGSVRAAINLLAESPGRRLLLLGEMLELGPGSQALHREMGELAAARGIERLIGVGAAVEPAVTAFGEGGQLFADLDALAPSLAGLLADADVILVKGSRGAAMERVLDVLRRAAGEAA